MFLYKVKNLSLSEVADRLSLKDKRTVNRWLKENNIPFYKIGNRLHVDEFQFEFKRQQLVVEKLMKLYPNQWFEIYDVTTTDKLMVQAIFKLFQPKLKANRVNTNKKRKFIK